MYYFVDLTLAGIVSKEDVLRGEEPASYIFRGLKFAVETWNEAETVPVLPGTQTLLADEPSADALLLRGMAFTTQSMQELLYRHGAEQVSNVSCVMLHCK